MASFNNRELISVGQDSNITKELIEEAPHLAN